MAFAKAMIAEHAAVASEQALASMAGYDVLRKGGNAFDAAVATSFALAVTFHPAGGLGGDFFGMFYEAKSGKVHCLNSSGWSPSGLTHDLVESRGGTVPTFGPLSCMVPGYVRGVWDIHSKLGSLEFGGLLSQAKDYAAKGFPAGAGICRSIAGAFGDLTEEARKVFAPGGRPPSPGEWIRQENLGKTISQIADEGPDSFYSGMPAASICAKLSDLGVPAKLEDFKDFRPEWVDPLSFDYRGTTVYEIPPNSMGATNLLILKLLSASELSKAGPLSKERIDLTMKAALAAYSRRDELLADPRFSRFDLEEFMSAPVKAEAPASRIRPGDTTAFSIADGEGNVVSGIQSLFFHFGSRVFVPECGIMMNNRGAGFLNHGPNSVGPRKRPLNTLSSMILERDRRPYLAIGTSGGDYRPLLHALFVSNAVDYGMPIEEIVGHPRFLWGGGRSLILEEGYEKPIPGTFEEKWLPMPGRTGVCQAVEISKSFRKAACDLRGDGIPSGF